MECISVRFPKRAQASRIFAVTSIARYQMPEAEKKKRQLRLGKESSSKSKLFNFESINPLLYQNTPIELVSSDNSNGKISELQAYHYYGMASKNPKLATVDTDLKYNDALLPRRQRLKSDPLSDERYTTFHRKMKREEKSMASADRNKLGHEIGNLKAQLQLLRQHDWVRHLPRMTVVNDARDMDELQRKRQLTEREIRRLLEKYDDWVRRDTKLQSDIRVFEKYMHNSGSSRLLTFSNRSPGITIGRHRKSDKSDSEESTTDSAEDNDESILTTNLAATKAKRQAIRQKNHGPTIRLLLRNGYEIVSGPFKHTRIEKTYD